jgi:hypothetical protein
MAEYKSPLNAFGIMSFNSHGLGEKLSNLLHISSAVIIPSNVRTVVTSGTTGYDENMVYPKDLTLLRMLKLPYNQQVLKMAFDLYIR